MAFVIDTGEGNFSELGTRSFVRGSLSAPHSIFSPGSLTLLRSFFEFSFRSSLKRSPLNQWFAERKRTKSLIALYGKIM
jgi:hypothetical protein